MTGINSDHLKRQVVYDPMVPVGTTVGIVRQEGAQRQDSLTEQLRDVALEAVRMGCYDAVDWINNNLISASARASVPPMTGTIVIRCPEGLHQQLTGVASQQGVSLNQLCVALLAGGIGFTLEES